MLKGQLYRLKLIFLALLFVCTARAESLVAFEGLIPGIYVNQDKSKFFHATLVVDRDTRLIHSIETNQEIMKALKSNLSIEHIELKRGDHWDVMYPGLIDLHNHTKYNNIGVLSSVKGQFANRFEWRPWGPYKKAVSGNINPWSGYGKAVTCAIFRWSELQAMTLGTTYLQGPSSCVDQFAIHRVEKSDAYVSDKANVQAPTDIVVPGDMVFVWNTLGPIIREIHKQSDPSSLDYKLAYEEAMARTINKYCPGFAEKGILINRETVRGDALQYLKDKDLLTEVCQQEDLPDKFIRYVYWLHKSIIGKKLYAESIAQGQGSAIIAHLAEGRQDDPYNQKEFEVIQLLGLDMPHVNFVHGVGISPDGLMVMGQKQMGLIWSPYSNLLLYSQTLDIKKATEAGVLLALGSDWLPTGTRGVLEEVKLARNYILKMGLAGVIQANTRSSNLDEALYKMLTENPAKMINHWQGPQADKWANGESQGGIGTLAKGAMATFIVTTKKHGNPYTNLVKEVSAKEINLVVVDGNIQYGNLSYLNQAKKEFELMPNGQHDMEVFQKDNVPFYVTPVSKQEEFNLIVELSQYIQANAGRATGTNVCEFTEDKGFVHQDSLNEESALIEFKQASGMNLDRYADIQKLIGINLATQTRNRNDPEKGDPDYIIEDFSPMFSCNDQVYTQRLTHFVHPDPKVQTDEYSLNLLKRDDLIQSQNLGKTPKRLADQYPTHTH